MEPESKHLIIVTCTWNRPCRLSYFKYLIQHIFSQLSNYTWIVVEDGTEIDNDLKKILPEKTIYFAHGPTKDGGNKQRNAAYEYIHDNQFDGIVYNADDDNTYDLKLFDEIRKTKIFSIFPVLGWNRPKKDPERPLLDENGKFIRWNSSWHRKYATDMAGFAFNSSLLQKIEKPFWRRVGHGGGESEFIDSIIGSIDEVEFLCGKCSIAYVKHNGLCEIYHPDISPIKIQSKENIDYSPRRGRTSGKIKQYHEASEKLFTHRTLTIQDIYTIENIYNTVPGAFDSPDRLELLCIINNILNIKDSTIIEIGSWKGRVSSGICSFIDKSNDYFIVDDFKTNDGLDRCDLINENLKSNFIDNMKNYTNYKLIENNILNIDWKQNINKPINYVFYDACPNTKLCVTSIQNIIPYSGDGLIIDFHDAYWPEISNAIDTLCRNNVTLKKKFNIDIWEGFVSISKN
jgi:galactosylgalactosylxylosylprotein 3-beta-glucuronosyltransferase 3